MIRAILFDKDGTLTDFRATWERWMPSAVRELAAATGADADVLADGIGIDLATGRILPDGRFVTATNAQTMALVAPLVGWSAEALIAWWGPRVVAVPQVQVTPLPPLLADLRARGLRLGVLTNADEAEARRHLAELGALPFLDGVIGCDSGHGAKPDPRGAAAFAAGLDLAPAEVLMVGDGMTDLDAARGAGLRRVAVLTGTLDRATLAPHAEAVLDDIRALPGWLDAQVA